MKKEKSYIAVLVMVALCYMIIISYFVFSECIGGDAVNGYREAGKYFVAGHGEVTEVSKTIWTVSRIWTVSVWLSAPTAMIGSMFLYFKNHE